MKREVYFFEKAGPANTTTCVEVVCRAVRERGFSHVVVASTYGETGALFAEALSGLDEEKKCKTNLVVVTHSCGFKEPGVLELTEESRKKIEKYGGRILISTILTHSIETSFNQKYGGLYPTMIVSESLRRFGQGAKVAVEIVMEAVDAGLIPEGVEVLAVGGTGRGADTVLTVLSAASKRFLGLRVLEILAKPRE